MVWTGSFIACPVESFGGAGEVAGLVYIREGTLLFISVYVFNVNVLIYIRL